MKPSKNMWYQSALVCAVLLLATAAGWVHPAVAGVSILTGGITYSDIATTAVADVSETFKRVYLKAVNAVPDATALTAQLNRSGDKVKAGPDGLYFNVKLQTGGPVANVPDGKLLPRAGRPQTKQGKIGVAHTYSVIAVGGQSIPLTNDTRNAFVGNLEQQMEDAMLRVRLDLERQYNGDGLGILCLIKTVVGAPTYGVEKPYGFVNGGPGCMLLVEDMDVVTMNPVGPAERGRDKIASLDVDNETMTTSNAIAGTAIGDYVVLCNDNAATGTDKATNYNSEAVGISAVCSSGDTFENINGATYRRWGATALANGGTTRPITEKLVAQLEARIMAKSGQKPDLLYTTRGISIELQDQLAGLRRFDGEQATFKGGYTGVSIGGRKILEGDFCAKSRLYALNTSDRNVAMVDLVKMGFVDMDGAKLHRVEGRHTYRADLYFPHNAAWYARNAHGVIKDLEDDNTIVRY